MIGRKPNVHVASEVAGGLQAAHHKRGEQEGGEREGSDGEQQQIDGAVQALATAAVSAAAEMVLVVAAEPSGCAGDVIPPTGEDGPDYMVGAGFVSVGM
jgi:hypothetical protein